MKKKHRLALTLLLIIIVTGFSFGVVLLAPKPPLVEIEQARVSIQEARRIIHADFVPESLIEAETLYDTAINRWKIENERFFLFRKYDTVRTIAVRSAELATKSPEEASNNHSGFQASLENDLKKLNTLIKSYKDLAGKLPLDKRTSNRFSKGMIEVKEAEQALSREQLKESRRLVDLAKQNLESTRLRIDNLLDNYFEAFPQWKLMVDKAITESAIQKSSLIVVDKFASACHLYVKGKLKYTFEAEFGPNWIGHKEYAGDNATPEGVYRVTRKKEGRNTKYYKALLIDYPNDRDKANFKKSMAEGRLSRSAKIGGLIEIHGDGGRGSNWTNGCVALSNSDMDRLYASTPLHCKVIIVGSLSPLNEIIRP